MQEYDGLTLSDLPKLPVGKQAKALFDWMKDHLEPLFDGISAALGWLIEAVLRLLSTPPGWTDAAGEVVPAVEIGYGTFLNALIQFIIVAFAIFMVVKAINRLNRKEEAAPEAPAEPSEDVLLLREIRDSLKR